MNKRTDPQRPVLSTNSYRFKRSDIQFKMRDNTIIGGTVYIPVRKQKNEQFPVLLEILPYRKDDTFFLLDYPAYAYFARHGFIVLKVDIRGTGSSSGALPDREYSDQEIQDALEVIRQAAQLPKANGNVGMFGVSWSGFNSIQVAMEGSSELKAILAMHASDDLYKDDLHYIDGVLHVDPYHLYINHENGLPKTPHYRLDQPYFKNRFNKRPWLFRYLKEQTDGEFWSRKSLSSDYRRLTIPAYLIGGLMDGYRDTVVRILENGSAPVKAEIGPWDHSCPDGDIGPQHEWQDEAIRWFEHYLKGLENGIGEEMSAPKHLVVFQRDGHEPDPSLSLIPGSWRKISWPSQGGEKPEETKLYPSANGKLRKTARGEKSLPLAYLASSGVDSGLWWGDTTGDMSTDDGRSLTFDSPPLKTPLVITGIARAALKVSAGARRANWTVRLEDVHPDGRVSLITGAILNGRHISGRAKPTDLDEEAKYEIELDLHFTTWTFKPGHRIRLAVGNAQFPLAWPSPYKMTTYLDVGCAATWISLPVSEPGEPVPPFAAVKEKPESLDGEYLEIQGGKPELRKYTVKDLLTGQTAFHHETNSAYRIKRRGFTVSGTSVWTVNDKDPAKSGYRGHMWTRIRSSRRTVRLSTRIDIDSDKHSFRVRFTRKIFLNGKLFKKAHWEEEIPRVNS